MEIEILEDITKNIEIASRELGLEKKEFVRRALLFYIHNLIEEKNLKEELEAWENAGIEDLKRFYDKYE